jgi:arabinose-5-phosphate isomerase
MTATTISSSKALVTSLLQDFHASTDLLFRQFDTDQFCCILNATVRSQGVLFFTGVGKSGIIAKKIVMTMNSLGMKAFYLSSQDALHGDIGVVGANDTVFFLSKSGETSELIDLCPALRNKGAFLVAVVSSPKSRLGLACDDVFVLPSLRELCPFDIAPTTSTLAQLVFGDLLAMSLMRMNDISLEEFIQNHPAGRIGRRQLLKVKDLMITSPRLPQCASHDSLGDTLVELSNKQCGCICVLGQEHNLLGIFTDGDLRRALQQHGPAALGLPIHSLMTPNPRTISPDALAYEAMQLMEADQKHPVTVLVVVDNNACVGLIKMHDILQSGV